MRQSEYTQYYERWGNVKYPVRGKLFMRHRGRAIYVRGGILTDGLTGMVIPRIMGRGRDNLNKSIIAEQLDFFWEKLAMDSKSLPKTQWRSRRGGVITVNGKVIATKEDTHEQRD